MKYFFIGILLLIGFSSCSNRAIIKTEDENYKAKIIAGDDKYIYLKNKEEEYALVKAEIENIWHPGKKRMIFGSMLILMGLTSFIEIKNNPDKYVNEPGWHLDRDRSLQTTMSITGIVAGSGLFYYGLYNWRASRKNANFKLNASANNLQKGLSLAINF